MGGSTGSRWVGTGPLRLSQARNAVQGTLDQLGNPDLQIKEIMIFDNQAYAEISEKSTGVGAMEILVDPATLSVYPEPGPNMMWNLMYSPMNGSPGWGMMGRRVGSGPPWPRADLSPDMPISGQQAITIAQTYLDDNHAGASAGDEADPFYGYYTIHVLRNGKVTGMLSVNGFTGAVFPHTWHGAFVEMTDD